MEKTLGTISFVGGIIIIFLGLGMVLMEGSGKEKSETLEMTLMALLFVTGSTTMLYVWKSGLGKGKTN